MNQRINIITPAGPDTRAYAFNDGYQSLDEYNRQNPPRVPKWKELENEMLANSRRDATRGERSAAEQALWEQVSGKASAAQPSAQLQSDWARFQATRTQPSRRLIELEAKLFEQVAAIGPRRHLGADSSHFAGKPGL